MFLLFFDFSFLFFILDILWLAVLSRHSRVVHTTLVHDYFSSFRLRIEETRFDFLIRVQQESDKCAMKDKFHELATEKKTRL